MVAPLTTEQEEAKRLSQAVKNWSDEPLKRFRSARRDMLRTYGGLVFAGNPDLTHSHLDHYDVTQILPLFYSMTSIFLPQLRVKPNPLVTTRKPMLRGFAELTELAIEFVLKEIQYAAVLRMATLEALYGRGITVTVMGDAEPGGPLEPGGEMSKGKRPIIRQVSEDLFIEDTAKRTWRDRPDFRGHRFSVPYQEALDSGKYDNDLLEGIFKRDTKRRKTVDATSGITTPERFVDEVQLSAIWLPAQKRVVTMAGNMDLVDGYLRTDGYKGPVRGPYNILSFMPMPDSTIPIPPMSVIYDLQAVLNQIAEKISDQALAQKDILIVQAGDETQMKAARDSDTNEIISGQGKGTAKFSLGGVNESNYRSAAWLHEQLNQMSGNPNVLGGTGSQSPTLGQEELLVTSAGTVQVDRKERVQEFASRDCNNVAFHLWRDTGAIGRTLDLIQSLPAPIGDVPVQWTATDREGTYTDYNFEIEAYSAAAASPEARYQQIVRWLSQVVMPLSQIGASQGTIPDVATLARITGKYLEIEEAGEIFSEGGIPSNAPTVSSPSGGAGGGGRPGTAVPGRLREQNRAPSSGPPVGVGAAGS